MLNSLILGGAFGAIAGLPHACSLYAKRVRQVTADGAHSITYARAAALYCAAWTLGLWMLFGSYVLMLLLVSLLVYAAYRAVKLVRSNRR